MLIQRHTFLRILLDDDEYDKGEGWDDKYWPKMPSHLQKDPGLHTYIQTYIRVSITKQNTEVFNIFIKNVNLQITFAYACINSW